MYAALSRSVCALLSNMIWGFETTSISHGLSQRRNGAKGFLDYDSLRIGAFA